MSRCFFLSAGGDPFLADFVLSLWKKHWYNEVDIGYIAYNNHAEVPLPTAYEFLRKWERDPKVRIIYTPHGVGNGTPVTQMLLNSKEEFLLLLEDDSFIFTPAVVNTWFSYLESGVADVVGSPRYTVGEVADAAKRMYNLDYSGYGDIGFGWWPSFFVCKRSDLLRTDLDFASKKYPAGVYFKELDHTFVNDDYTDTFTWASIQLRYLGVREYKIPQNHAHPYDGTGSKTLYVLEDHVKPTYIHGGSLSSGWGGYLNKKLPPVNTDMEKQDIETRVAFWTIAMGACEGYETFKKEYTQALSSLVTNAVLDSSRITKKINLYMDLMHLHI